LYPIGVIAAPSKVHPHVPALSPAQARKRLCERGSVSLPHGIGLVARQEHGDAPYAVALLRPRRERPRCRRSATESGDEFSSCNGGGHLRAPVLKPKANDTMIEMVVSSGSHNSIHGRTSARGHEQISSG
jgi:hypothetical protein